MAAPPATPKEPVYISYQSPHRLYGLCWGTKPNDLRVAASTFIDGEYVNKLQVRATRPLHY